MTKAIQPRRPTLKEIAAKAGISAAAVSMALRHHGNIPPATVARVERIAAALGYRPDPEIARLMARLRQSRVRRPSGTLALINLFPSSSLARHNPQLARLVNGIRDRSAALGYTIDEFSLGGNHRLQPARLASMLVARGIEGIILPGGPEYLAQIDFPFEKFATAIVGSSIGLKLHRSSAHQFLDMLTVVERLQAKKYRAPGLVLRTDTDLRVRHQHSAAFIWAQHHFKAWRRIPGLLSDEVTEQLFARWVKRYQPDVIIAQSPRAPVYLEWLASLKLSVPGDIGFVSLDIDLSDPPVSGIVEGKEEYAAAAIDLVIAQLHRGERGFPARPKNVLLQGEWREGPTLRPDVWVAASRPAPA